MITTMTNSSGGSSMSSSSQMRVIDLIKTINDRVETRLGIGNKRRTISRAAVEL